MRGCLEFIFSVYISYCIFDIFMSTLQIFCDENMESRHLPLLQCGPPVDHLCTILEDRGLFILIEKVIQ